MSHTTLTIRSSQLQARFLRRGATLCDLRFAGEDHSLVLGFQKPADYTAHPVYAGAIVGPVANRITHGRITADGARFQMPANEPSGACLHSGNAGLHARDWSVHAHSSDALYLGIELPDGAQGLPGKRSITVEYRLTDSTLCIKLTARTDRTTPMNLAAHPYWCLDPCGDISSHDLQIDARHYLPVDDDLLPSGKIAPVANTTFDFRTPRRIPLTAELDVNFCLHDASRTHPQPVATLTGASGRALRIATNAPGLQVYNGAFLPRVPDVLQSGIDLFPFAGIALEPQHWPDAPNHPHFPSIILRPDEEFSQTTLYELTPSAKVG